MESITINYLETGFGDPIIDLELEPFNNMLNKNIINNGFGNNNLLFENNLYINNREFNFGSKTVAVEENLVKYDYSQIFESGIVDIERNSFLDIKIKNKLISSPVINFTVIDQINVFDMSVYTESINNKTFRVFNENNRRITVSYTATQNITKKLPISSNQLNKENINLNILNSLIEIPTITTYIPQNDYNINLNNYRAENHSGYSPNGNLVLDSNHDLLILENLQTTGSYILPEDLGLNNYLTLKTQTLASAQQANLYFTDFSQIFIKTRNTPIYLLSNPDDTSTGVVQNYNVSIYNYGFALSENTTYYFWYDSINNYWYLSTQRFPNIVTYT